MTRKAADSKTDKINRVTGAVIHVSVKLIIYILIVVLFYYGVTTAYRFGLRVFSRRTMTSQPGIEMRISIREGDSVTDVGRTLEDMGVIHDGYAFVFQKYFYQIDLEPGIYTVNTAMTVKEVLEALHTEETESDETEE